MTTNPEDNYYSELSTFRNTENVSIHGGTFSMTNAEQRTHMDSGRQPQAHNGNTHHRSSRNRDRRRPYSRNLQKSRNARQSKYDPEPPLTSGAGAPSPSSDQHRMPSAATLPTTLTSPNQRATFGNADVANVSGGVFFNSHTVQLYPGLLPEGISRPHTQGCNIVHGTDRNLSGPGGLARPSNSETNVPPTVRADYDIYYHQLLAKRRGSPMWMPGPDMNLPVEYRKEGIRIGDVGILYRSEGFGFLFNIFLPAHHPINEGRVPPGFGPLNLSHLEHRPREQVFFGPKSYLTSTSVATSSNMDSSKFIFETSAAEGAVLIMPDGAITEDLVCRKSIKKYLAKNAETWYEFVSEVCGLDVDNGDIRLVIGFDKVSSWGIATSSCSVGERVRLEFKNISDISQTYTWHCAGSHGGSGRVGPCNREMQGIISLQEADRSPPLQNQCVFLRTLNFDLSGKCWNGLMNHQIRSSDSDHHFSDSAPPGSHHYAGARPGPEGSDGGGLGGGGSHSTSGGVTFYATQSDLSAMHPSNSINKILLDKYPKAQIAITEDADWISVITKDDVEIPKADELCTRLLATREVCEEDGIITFRSEEDFTNSEDNSSLTFASENHVYDSDVAVVNPTEEKGKGAETAPLPPTALLQLPAQTFNASLPTTTTNKQPTMPVHQELSPPAWYPFTPHCSTALTSSFTDTQISSVPHNLPPLSPTLSVRSLADSESFFMNKSSFVNTNTQPLPDFDFGFDTPNNRETSPHLSDEQSRANEVLSMADFCFGTGEGSETPDLVFSESGPPSFASLTDFPHELWTISPNPNDYEVPKPALMMIPLDSPSPDPNACGGNSPLVSVVEVHEPKLVGSQYFMNDPDILSPELDF